MVTWTEGTCARDNSLATSTVNETSSCGTWVSLAFSNRLKRATLVIE